MSSRNDMRLHVYGCGGDSSHTFSMMCKTLADWLRQAEPINRGQWQTLNVVNSRAHDTFELRNVSLFYTVPESLVFLQSEVKADQPWAEAHFLERVGRVPLNPAPSHLQWPHGNNGNQRHLELAPREIDDRDWAYLAALIDGDGCINIFRRREGDPGRPRIAISQKDHEFIHALYDRYQFGKVSARERDNVKTPDGKIRRSNAAVWLIDSKALVKYVLEHIIPYLMLKKDIAIEALQLVSSLEPHHDDKPMEMEEAKFSHTYPERFWPRHANNATQPRRGIRYDYGDLDGVVQQLVRNPLTRQAVLPMWGFEDTGATDRRVPCSLTYHFMSDADMRLSVWYNLRACDFVRHFHNDVYFAARLLQWVCSEYNNLGLEVPEDTMMTPGEVNMTISSLHTFRGDLEKMP